MADFSKLNFVNVGPGGTFRASGDVRTTPEDVDAIFEHLRTADTQKLVLYFHGGLVPESAGMATAEKMWPVFKDHAHPVTFVWETGFLETLGRNLKTIASTRLFRKVVKFAIREVAKGLGGDVTGRGPGQAPSDDEIEAELAAAARFTRYDAAARGAVGRIDEADLDALQAGIEADLEVELASDPEVIDILDTEVPNTPLVSAPVVRGPAGKGVDLVTLAVTIGKIVIAVMRRYLRRRDHGFYPTVVEETLRAAYLADFGAWVWGGMRDAAQGMWQPNDGLSGDEQHAGTYFLAQLDRLMLARPSLVVDAVGHSAGAIAICHLLAAASARHPNVKIRNLALMAPACAAGLLHDEVLKHPERYAQFRMYTMRDDLESEDELVPGVYTRSLLYFISGVLESEADAPLAGLERHSRGSAPYDSVLLSAVHDFLRQEAPQRLVLSTTTGAPAGFNSTARSHGAFDDDTPTRESLAALVAA